jgi:hypothetical protein
MISVIIVEMLNSISDKVKMPGLLLLWRGNEGEVQGKPNLSSKERNRTQPFLFKKHDKNQAL